MNVKVIVTNYCGKKEGWASICSGIKQSCSLDNTRMRGSGQCSILRYARISRIKVNRNSGKMDMKGELNKEKLTKGIYNNKGNFFSLSPHSPPQTMQN